MPDVRCVEEVSVFYLGALVAQLLTHWPAYAAGPDSNTSGSKLFPNQTVNEFLLHTDIRNHAPIILLY